MSLNTKLRLSEEELKTIDASELIQELYNVLSNSEDSELPPLEIGKEYDLKSEEYSFLELKCHKYFEVQKIVQNYFSDFSQYMPKLLFPEKVNDLPQYSRDAVLTLMYSNNSN